jgi:hypothetical protein
MAITSAQVILRPSAVPTAPAVIEAFRQAGFTVGPLVANNFSVSGSDDLFEKLFGVGLPETRGVQQETQLPLKRLAPQIRRAVQAVVFTKPPDFGPGNY